MGGNGDNGGTGTKEENAVESASEKACREMECHRYEREIELGSWELLGKVGHQILNGDKFVTQIEAYREDSLPGTIS